MNDVDIIIFVVAGHVNYRFLALGQPFDTLSADANVTGGDNNVRIGFRYVERPEFKMYVGKELNFNDAVMPPS